MPKSTPHPAPFVWAAPAGLSRNQHVYFRQEFSLKASPKKAVLNVFADSHYYLFVNGRFLGGGPARFYPQHPQFDTHDLSPHLVAGRNVIAIHGVFEGITTFRTLMNKPGLCAWGEIQPAKGSAIAIGSAKGFKCFVSPAWNADTPRLSFAQGPIQDYDERLDPAGWESAGFDDSRWAVAKAVADQDAWGKLAPRSAPRPPVRPVPAGTFMGARQHDTGDTIYSLRIHCPVTGYRRALAYTYIHCPRAQRVTAGIWWGDYWLNGKPVQVPTVADGQTLRYNVKLDLKEGWNFFFVSYGHFEEFWDFQFALPVAAGLRLSPYKRLRDRIDFRTAGPFDDDQRDKVLTSVALPLADPSPQPSPRVRGEGEKIEPPLAGMWVDRQHSDLPPSAVKSLAWMPLLPQKSDALPVAIRKGTSLIYDFGRVRLARIIVDFDAPAGTRIDVGHSEELRDSRPHYAKSFLVQTVDRHIARGGPGRFMTLEPRGVRYVEVAVHHPSGPVSVRDVRLETQAYEHQQVGSFECSDESLTRLWEIGRNALDACSEEIYLDCPWRERTLYSGDLLVSIGTAMVCSGDTALARRCLELFLQSASDDAPFCAGRVPAPHAGKAPGDYSLLVAPMVDWLVTQTADTAFARRAYPVLRRMMDACTAYIGPGGVLNLPHGPFIDHLKIDRKAGTYAAMNALASAAFTAVANLATMLKKPADAKADRARARELARGVELFWHPGDGAFSDSLTPGTVPGRSHFPASSAWPMVFGVCDSGHIEALERYFQRRLASFDPYHDDEHFTPYGGFYVLGGLYRAGLSGLAQRYMRRCWGPMLEGDNGQTWEAFDRHKSLCHVWSSAPTYYLSTRVLGVRLGFPEPADPSSILIAPEAASIAWARGTVPHPLGLVHVEWHRSGRKLRVVARIPKGARCQIKPAGDLAGLKVRAVIERI